MAAAPLSKNPHGMFLMWVFARLDKLEGLKTKIVQPNARLP
jgi:hypothetical protein